MTLLICLFTEQNRTWIHELNLLHSAHAVMRHPQGCWINNRSYSILQVLPRKLSHGSGTHSASLQHLQLTQPPRGHSILAWAKCWRLQLMNQDTVLHRWNQRYQQYELLLQKPKHSQYMRWSYWIHLVFTQGLHITTVLIPTQYSQIIWNVLYKNPLKYLAIWCAIIIIQKN